MGDIGPAVRRRGPGVRAERAYERLGAQAVSPCGREEREEEGRVARLGPGGVSAADVLPAGADCPPAGAGSGAPAGGEHHQPGRLCGRGSGTVRGLGGGAVCRLPRDHQPSGEPVHQLGGAGEESVGLPDHRRWQRGVQHHLRNHAGVRRRQLRIHLLHFCHLSAAAEGEAGTSVPQGALRAPAGAVGAGDRAGLRPQPQGVFQLYHRSVRRGGDTGSHVLSDHDTSADALCPAGGMPHRCSLIHI